MSESPASTEWFATRVRGLGAITILLGQPYRLDAVLQTASERASRIVVFVDGREAAALPLLETLRIEPASRGVPLGLLHRLGGWLPLPLRRAFVTAAAPGSTDTEIAAAVHILARAAKSASIAEPGTDVEHGEEGSGRPGMMSQAKRRRLHVLVAVGHRTTQLVVARMLEVAGHAATSGKDEDQVLEALGAEDFDAAIVDLDHPEMSGTEIATFIRMTGLYKLPIIGLSASTESSSESLRSASALLQGILPKPVNPGQLLEMLDRLSQAGAASSTMAPSVATGLDRQEAQVTNIESHPLFGAGAGEAIAEKALSGVAALGDGAFVKTLAQAFVGEATATIKLLAAAAAARDRSAWMIQIRALRTQAQSLGAERLASLCETGARIENKSLTRDGKRFAERFSAELDRVRKALEHLS